ncbi:MAG: hypothetical protein M3433_03515 [Actinomycetota bacterium]|nr:hypothetical protein [Actinomycetota bacterium]
MPHIVDLISPHGHLDVCLLPDGFPRGYEDLLINAEQVPVAQTTRTANVADAADILHSKTTANRQKDRDMLPALRAAFEQAGSLQPAADSRRRCRPCSGLNQSQTDPAAKKSASTLRSQPRATARNRNSCGLGV